MSGLLAWEGFGERGEPLLILHGLFGSRRNWQSVAGRLAERYRVYTVDIRNHGQSFHRPEMDYLTLSDDLRRLADALELDRFRVVGHSMGGKIAMAGALRFAERVRHLIVVDIAPVSYSLRFTDLVDALSRLDLATPRDRAAVDAALAASVPDRLLRAFLLQNLTRTERGFAWRLNLAAIRAGLPELMDFPAELSGGRYAGPVDFIAGGRSPSIAPAHHPRIRQLFPSARIETIAEAGHWPHSETPEAFWTLLSRVLDREAGRGGVS